VKTRQIILVVIGAALVASAGFAIALRTLPRKLALRRPKPTDFQKSFVDVAEGDDFCLPGLHTHAPAAGAVIIAIGSKCEACSTSKGFDERLYEEAQSRGIPAYFLLSNKSENGQSAAGLRAAGRNVVIGDPVSYGVSRIPTALRVDAANKIVSMWTGTVSQAKEHEVIQALLSGSSLQKYSTIDQGLLPKYARDAGTTVLSLSARGARQDLHSKVIPSSELSLRARYELERGRLIVVDCASLETARSCQESVLHLVRMRFHVLAAGLPRNSLSCRSGS
jgi:hypothetical protein